MRTVITYGTFDLFHAGHVKLLDRLAALGDRLIVGVSTDEFNAVKGKAAVFPFEDRCLIVSALRCVDLVIPERTWEQKRADILHHKVDVFGMGDDWRGRFDGLNDICTVTYLPRTPSISTTEVKERLGSAPERDI